MIKIALVGHEFRYEAFQIASLFYEKNEFQFVDYDEADYYSIYDENAKTCTFKSKDSTLMYEEIVDDTKKNIKIGLKSSMINALKSITGKEIPWGILIGIRPTKLYHEFVSMGMVDEEIKEVLINKYYLNPDKADLLIEVAKGEKPFLTYEDGSVSVYIGIPFCPTRCVYCSFTSNPIGTNKHLVDDYLSALVKEINYTFSLIKDKGIKVDTLYIGGGTPTSLNEKQLEILLKTVSENIETDRIREYTVEAGRPDSINEEKLKLIKKYGATRISINPQTMSDETLKNIGRTHTSSDIKDKFNIARSLGFDNINMDIIIGLPGETANHVETTISEIKQLNPDSITIHTMAIKRASKLCEDGYSIENSEAKNMYDVAVNGVISMGMKPYYMYRQKNMVSPLENIGYSYRGKESIYNVQMISENISIIGLGADSVSKAIYRDENRLERIANLKDVREYIKRIDEILGNKKKALDMVEESFR
ncbi:coproporphyrinogen dehydrogenase HemZ [Clostridium cylindrosporum]|uniref:Oxygen-independent coproporphyrinogen-III oxidase-like protein HemZ n=1 Tax=Clostridium cylindrosporum DSM 605 TaxID=1121307 RepID=A0A0J8G0F9_CLOCY|nr:coproporphyrinogen dehydrogenase HemZ [Clostridium cylindrosporum]KMT21276.1 oxygen-independent coproporphyrinogen-III oxidase-like protein HemZ [Clostridium cylindrosporum DSM 605]